MSARLITGKNNLSMKCGEKLYLDSETADVKFVIQTNAILTIETSVPAHKNILSVGSPVFKAMFYGPMKEKGDVKIVDTSPNGFKEFLQFFYLEKVQLTSHNIISVMKLCHKYEVADGLTFCEKVLQKILTINDMCSAYELARLLDLKSTIIFCKQKIQLNPEGILKSDDFLKCNSTILDKILELVSSIQSNQCSPSTIVDASMAWAKAECVRNELQGTPSNLRAQLNDSFHRIPFSDLSKEQFSQHVSSYKRFFNEDDLKSIMTKKISISRCCDLPYFLYSLPFECTLTLDARLVLKEIHFVKTPLCTSRATDYNVKAAITLRRRKDDQPLLLGNVNISSTIGAKLIVPVQVVIDQNEEYILTIDSKRRLEYILEKTSIFKQNDVEPTPVIISKRDE
ncbi:BTB/POZ domain-containing protein 6-like [Contarinia nasturtii]|uniref:BTB/POZ domain-containing protein 6-like n=1 Tax=Contarinia nasturtii TaxID=265458 RepID=UPI0012D3EA1F|nr:BTB/POZ domain-containing protein 6-like [Contarinia nasturtii]